MNDAHTKYLYATYPKLYRQHTLPMSKTCMCWNFECGTGWFGIIDDLSRRITEIDEREGNETQAVQVKEKFGTLRFYTDFETDAVSEAIREAEERSAVTCEECGKPGTMRERHGWLMVRCDEHAKGDR